MLLLKTLLSPQACISFWTKFLFSSIYNFLCHHVAEHIAPMGSPRMDLAPQDSSTTEETSTANAGHGSTSIKTNQTIVDSTCIDKEDTIKLVAPEEKPETTANGTKTQVWPSVNTSILNKIASSIDLKKMSSPNTEYQSGADSPDSEMRIAAASHTHMEDIQTKMTREGSMYILAQVNFPHHLVMRVKHVSGTDVFPLKASQLLGTFAIALKDSSWDSTHMQQINDLLKKVLNCSSAQTIIEPISLSSSDFSIS